MLTQLSTLKSRLGLADTDLLDDPFLLGTIRAVGARFEAECRRRFDRVAGAQYEFRPEATRIAVDRYPVERVLKFELKTSEAAGWQEQPGVDYVVRRACVICLASPLDCQPSAVGLARVTFDGGYVLPGDPDPAPAPGGLAPARLPADLEQAAVEQVAHWYQQRDRLGLSTSWPHGGTYERFEELDLLSRVRAVLKGHERWQIG
jgi:hypothetical protein